MTRRYVITLMKQRKLTGAENEKNAKAYSACDEGVPAEAVKLLGKRVAYQAALKKF